MHNLDSLIYRLEKRVAVRKMMRTSRKDEEEENHLDRITLLLEEAAYELKRIRDEDSVAGYGDNDTQQGSTI
tara:strand:- start:1786 stop:2001 length:216 start_codon:yes stop_codon:yes gene_type:complete